VSSLGGSETLKQEADGIGTRRDASISASRSLGPPGHPEPKTPSEKEVVVVVVVVEIEEEKREERNGVGLGIQRRK